MSYTILALETSTERCSVALLVHNHLLEQQEEGTQKASLHVLGMIHNLLSKSNIFFSNLDLIVFGQGPGTFTGVRLGASIAQSLAFAHDLPIVAVSSLACLAEEAHLTFSKGAVLGVQDARMGAVYWGAYQIEENNHYPLSLTPYPLSLTLLKTIIPDTLQKPSEISIPENLLSKATEWVGVGSGWKAYSSVLETRFAPYLHHSFPNCYPMARALIPLAIQKFEKGETLQPEHALPVYLREAL
ncbi:MAG: tRNA (adenosine(37)-N6)-threonylcarbamoyltransferase complex dimerization subunit type 1 TsaB [Gammaproteobacteria bacterium]|nr:tRNA (adenosine(37)-N6)-threonylcarbamoyltransferase complex dimerization subunit type 1 TsaB [Gammaproteobacteria bacterium]